MAKNFFLIIKFLKIIKVILLLGSVENTIKYKENQYHPRSTNPEAIPMKILYIYLQLFIYICIYIFLMKLRD